MTFVDFMYKGVGGYLISSHTFTHLWGLIAAIAVAYVLCMIVPYFVGGLNFGIIVSRLLYHDDIRKYGSGNAGMTNMLRTYGKKAAALTLAGDFLKSFVGIMFGRACMGLDGAYLAGLFVVLGHMFPMMYKFKGGKGVVATATMVLFLDWRVFLILITLFVLLVWATKFMSLGSVICAMIYPILLSRISSILPAPLCGNHPTSGFCILIAFVIAAIIVFMHRGNIKRIFNGTESKVSFKKKDKKLAEASEKEDE